MLIAMLLVTVLFVGLGLGALSLCFAVYRQLLAMSVMGKPVLVTIPGQRPQSSVTYAVTPRGWRRIGSKNRRARAM